MPHSGTHDGSALLLVQQELDQGSSLSNMLAGLGDGQAHGNLGEAAVVIAELDLLADGEAVLVVVIQSGRVLGSSGIPLEDACDLTGDPLVGLVGGGVGVCGVVVLQVHHDVAIDQALDEAQALGDLVLGVVQGRGNGICPVLAVLGLEVEHHQDHTVVSAQVHGIVVSAQLVLESLAGCHQVIQSLGDFGDAGLIKGGHVPEEDTAGHGNGHALLGVCNVAGIHGSLVPLGQIQEVGHGVQVHELAAVSRVVVQPVPVHLAHILCVAGDESGSHLLFPAGPCGEGGLDGDVAVLSLELLDGVLVSLVTAVAAPPADGHGNRAVRQGQALVCGSSGADATEEEAAVLEELPPQAASRPAAPTTPVTFMKSRREIALLIFVLLLKMIKNIVLHGVLHTPRCIQL